MAIHGVTTYLWFDDCAMEAAELYVSLFPESAIGSVSHYQEGGRRPAGMVLVAEFTLFGQPFAALNGGPEFTHSPAVSLQVACDTQEELDRIWFGLIEGGGSESQCGWCIDRFGVSWQVIPTRFGQLMQSGDPDVSGRVFAAMMSMTKFDIAALEAAAADQG
jgi:predicted 3-demethylubiquinone-9 3-methyltransferase (glyoxalase superfamily)